MKKTTARSQTERTARPPVAEAPTRSPKQLELGAVIPGTSHQYTLQEHVGQGGMGNVYKALRSDGQLVAVKHLSSDRFHITDAVRQRFLREAHIASQLDHPCVVRSVDFVSHADELFLVMEYLPGETLQKRLVDNGAPSPEVGLEWMTRLAQGLAYLHDRGIVHRDLSPKNVVFRQNGTPAICDFGIARRVDDTTITTEADRVFGSLIYISPAQRENPHGAGFADDVFSLGKIYFYIVTGIVPLHVGAVGSHPNSHGRDIHQIVDRMTNHDPGKRLSDGNAVFLAIDAHQRRSAAGATPSLDKVTVVWPIGTSIYLQARTSPTVTPIQLTVFNPLDDWFTIESMRIDLDVAGTSVYSSPSVTIRSDVAPRRAGTISLPHITLPTEVAAIIRSLPNDWADLNLVGTAYCGGTTGPFEIHLRVSTRAPILRSAPNQVTEDPYSDIAPEPKLVAPRRGTRGSKPRRR